VIVYQYPLSEFPGGLALEAVAQDQGHQLRRYPPHSDLEAGVQVRPFGPKSCFSHRHKSPGYVAAAEDIGLVFDVAISSVHHV
jgi:hypothetical protein